MLKIRTSLKQTNALIDLTPLVDVILLMLVFFILTSDVLPFKSLNISLPDIDQQTPAQTALVGVVMDAQNVIYVGSRKEIVDLGSFPEVLKRELEKQRLKNPTPTVVLSVDKKVEYGMFLRLFSDVQSLGVPIRLSYQ